MNMISENVNVKLAPNPNDNKPSSSNEQSLTNIEKVFYYPFLCADPLASVNKQTMHSSILNSDKDQKYPLVLRRDCYYIGFKVITHGLAYLLFERKMRSGP